MRKIFLATFLLLLASCTQKQEILDNGMPGQIRVVVFEDQNRNGVQDSGELGLTDKVGLAQDISCPAQNFKLGDAIETSASGEVFFTDLDPGVYCVMYMGRESTTTKLAVEVYLSSEQQAAVGFGIPGE